MNILLVIIVSVIVFSALVMVMGLQTRQVVRITGTLVAVVLVVSSFIYGSCYAAIYDSFSIAVLKTVNAIIQMFLGNDEIGSISAAPLMQHQIFQIFVYIAHILAMYITISAVLTAVAMRLLRRISLLFARRGSLDLIYGVSDDTISFAESVLDSRRDTLVFVGNIDIDRRCERGRNQRTATQRERSLPRPLNNAVLIQTFHNIPLPNRNPQDCGPIT